MPTYIPKKSDYLTQDVDGEEKELLLLSSYDTFGSSLLGLGDISQDSRPTDAIAAMFDLEGFTNFSKQIEPHLSVPLFLNQFLDWLLKDIKKEMTQEIIGKGARLYGPLPFFVKFMGDGLLVIWDASKTDLVGQRNIVLSAYQNCRHYTSTFLPKIKHKVVDPPPILRCGLARGTVYSVGNGNDYVGSCINMAARLQKLPGTTFAFNRRGFILEGDDLASFFKNQIIIKHVSIRGIGDNELIAITKTEYNSMKASDKKQFKEISG